MSKKNPLGKVVGRLFDGAFKMANEHGSVIANIDSSNSVIGDSQEILSIVVARAEQKYNDEIAKCGDSMGQTEELIAQLEISMENMDYVKGCDIDQRMLPLAEALKPFGAHLAVGTVPVRSTDQGYRICGWCKSEHFYVVLTVRDAAFKSLDLQSQDLKMAQKIRYSDIHFDHEDAQRGNVCATTAKIADAIPGCVPLSNYMAEHWHTLSYDGKISIKFDHSQEFIAMRDQHRKLNEQWEELRKARDQWRAKKANIPSLERAYRAKIATHKLNMTEAGREILNKIMESLDDDILNLPVA